MGEIVNLNRARKDRAAATRKVEAEANRIAHGRAKSERKSTDAENSRNAKRLDAHKLDPGED